MFNHLNDFTKIYYQKYGRDFFYCDCYGLCFLYNKEVLNKYLPEFLDVDMDDKTCIKNAYNEKKGYFKKVKQGKETNGDIIVLKVMNYPLHVGVVLENNYMLHIMQDRFAVIEKYNSNKWMNKIDSIYRYEDFN